MRVIRAREAGACYGVQRALDMVRAVAAEGRTACTLGPLIHNPQVVEGLAAQGVSVARSVAEVPESSVVVIRSHGVTPEVRDAAGDRGLTVVDATCPHVYRAQKAAEGLARRGCHVIVVGEAGHPEVEGLTAYAREAGAAVDVVVRPDELPQHLADPVGVVVQTTQTQEHLDAVVDALRARGLSPLVKDTVCSATRQRQEAAAELARSVDAMVVIGGRNSSNTTRLAEICRASCPRTWHIEHPDEVEARWFNGCEVVGVTAGASTPEDQIQAVEDALRRL